MATAWISQSMPSHRRLRKTVSISTPKYGAVNQKVIQGNTAQISTSKRRNSKATLKNCTLKGSLLFVSGVKPHS